MVTNGVRDLVSPSEQAAQQQAKQAVASSAPQHDKQAKHADAKPAVAANQNLEIPLESVVKQLNSFLENSGRSLSFSIHQGSGKTVVQVYNSGTDELIRQFPAEQVLKLAEHFQSGDISGVLLDKQA